MKHKVRIFSDTYASKDLEIEINNWLDKNPNVTIVDIKYSISQCGSSGGSVYHTFSALIYYMEQGEVM